MLTLWGRPARHCDGVTRRGFLRVGAFGAGLTLADALRLRAGEPGGARPPHASTPKACVMIYLPGGPSHLDTYDPKPDAPAEYRGEFGTIPTVVPGVRVCDLLPMQARMFDKLAVVRSVESVDEHSDSFILTGSTEQANRVAARPSFGSVVSKLRGGGAVPPFVSLRGLTAGSEPGFLGPAHRAFSPDGPGSRNLRHAPEVDAERLTDRRSLLASFDGLRRDLDANGSMAGMDAFSARAFEMVASGTVRKALDLSREDPRVRQRYRGVEQFLTARRLVEAGVGFVTLSFGYWDTHAGNFRTLREQLPAFDRGLANFVQDLHDRGMQDDVATVVWGEFGRTPKVNGTDGGRDHWSPCMSVLVAGGGMKMGQAVGSSSSRGEYPKDRPYTVHHVLATLYRAAGIDPATTFVNAGGRPVPLLDEREPVAELL